MHSHTKIEGHPSILPVAAPHIVIAINNGTANRKIILRTTSTTFGTIIGAFKIFFTKHLLLFLNLKLKYHKKYNL